MRHLPPVSPRSHRRNGTNSPSDLLLLACTLPACSPKSKKTRAPSNSRSVSDPSGGASARPRKTPTDYKAIEKKINNLDNRIEQAKELLADCKTLKRKFDQATGAARKEIGSQIQAKYGDAGDIYDMIIDEATDALGGDDSKLDRLPTIYHFRKDWEKASKPFRRMSFR